MANDSGSEDRRLVAGWFNFLELTFLFESIVLTQYYKVNPLQMALALLPMTRYNGSAVSSTECFLL